MARAQRRLGWWILLALFSSTSILACLVISFIAVIARCGISGCGGGGFGVVRATGTSLALWVVAGAVLVAPLTLGSRVRRRTRLILVLGIAVMWAVGGFVWSGGGYG